MFTLPRSFDDDDTDDAYDDDDDHARVCLWGICLSLALPNLLVGFLSIVFRNVRSRRCSPPPPAPRPVHLWKHQFSSVCLSVVHEQAFGARMPSYRAIQDLDKKVRNFYVPPSLRVPGFGGAKMDTELTYPIQLTMQQYIGFAIKEISECCWAYF